MERQRSIELTIQQNKSVDMKELQSLHENILNNGYNNNDIANELTQILGGIDVVLSHYLSTLRDDNNLLLNDSQISSIHHILSTKNNKVNKTELKEDESTQQTNNYNENIDNNLNDITISLKAGNNYLNNILGMEAGRKIHGCMYHKIVIFVSILMVLFGMIVYTSFALNVDISIPKEAVIITLWFISIYQLLWLLLIIMSVNKTALPFILKSFEFWLKVLYSIFLFIMQAVNVWYITPFNDWSDVLQMLQFIEVLVIVIFSIMDGLYWELKSKFIVGVIIATYYSMFAFFGFFLYQDNEHTIIQITNHVSIKTTAISSSIYRVLAIFIWKQTIISLLKRDKATIINFSPYIKWISNNGYQIDEIQ